MWRESGRRLDSQWSAPVAGGIDIARDRDIPRLPFEVFWGEIAPCEHMVQFYEHDTVFLDTLEGYVLGGLRGGEAVVVLATEEHTQALERRLYGRVDLDAARAEDRYITVKAEDALGRFMVNQWPDDALFEEFVGELLQRAKTGGRRVRAFGELVAVLWSRGCSGATVRLEHLWHRLCAEQSFNLFCAYPRAGFTQNADDSIREICAQHSRLIAG